MRQYARRLCGLREETPRRTRARLLVTSRRRRRKQQPRRSQHHRHCCLCGGASSVGSLLSELSFQASHGCGGSYLLDRKSYSESILFSLLCSYRDRRAGAGLRKIAAVAAYPQRYRTCTHAPSSRRCTLRCPSARCLRLGLAVLLSQ